jgi:alpha-N-acetylglucosaminidase
VAGKNLTDLLMDMETLLASDAHFLLGTWLEEAKSFSSDFNEYFLLEQNARNQITIWGPNGEVTGLG